VIQDIDSHDELMDVLEDRANDSRTAKLWVDFLIKPVLLMMMFVRAKRDADWVLHMLAVSAMMPYFFASGHINYARYGRYTR
jgi:hypothetical protein